MNCNSVLQTSLTRSIYAFVIASAVLVASPTSAQVDAAARQTLCSNDQAQVELLSVRLSQTPLWDDATIARAEASLAKLRASRLTLIRLARRLNDASQSAANGEAFGRSGEANFWRRDAADVRSAIDAEKKRAKSLAADAGVSCPGCTYSALISKVEAAIAAAVSARSQAFQIQQQITAYRANLAAAGCRE